MCIKHDTHLVVIGEVAVGDGDSGGAKDDINQSITASLHGDMIDPNILRSEDGDPVAVAPGSETEVVGGVSDHAAVAGDDVGDPDAVDDHVLHELDGDAGAVGDVDGGAAAVDGLVARHDQLLVQPDHHAALEDDPQRLQLDHGVAEGPRLRVHHVVVGVVGDHVDLPAFPALGVAPEP